MAPIPSVHLLLWPLFAILATASVINRSTLYPASLRSHTERSFEELPFCGARCELDTCGARLCTTPKIPKLSRRGIPTEAHDIPRLNDTRETLPALAKRIFRLDIASNTYAGDEHPTTKEIDRYLPQVLNDEEQSYFGVLNGFFNGRDEAAVMHQRVFSSEPFQFGTGGIHGCTMVTLISNRAVWQAHFWETYSHGKVDTETGKNRAFKERVLDAMEGVPVTKPSPQKVNLNSKGMPEDTIKPYIRPVGSPIDPNLFNRDDDDTRLYISVPTPMGESEGERYTVRNDEIKRKVERIVGKRFKRDECILKYIALNYHLPEDRRIIDTSHRGLYLFQYDPNSDGKGQRAWRLFLENNWKFVKLP